MPRDPLARPASVDLWGGAFFLKLQLMPIKMTESRDFLIGSCNSLMISSSVLSKAFCQGVLSNFSKIFKVKQTAATISHSRCCA
jgi:hypothetical protein